MSFGLGFIDVEAKVLEIIYAVMYGCVCFFSVFAFLKALKKSAIGVKILAPLVAVYSGCLCILYTIEIFNVFSVRLWLYPYLIVTIYELSFLFIAVLYLSVWIELMPEHEKNGKQKLLNIVCLALAIFTLITYIAGSASGSYGWLRFNLFLMRWQQIFYCLVWLFALFMLRK